MSNKASFDAQGFYRALDTIRSVKGITWKDIAAETGVPASTFTRMAQNKRPDVDGLASLLRWSNLDVNDFVDDGTAQARREEAYTEPLAMVSTYLRADKNLSKSSADALNEIIRVSYEQLRKAK